MQTEQQWLTFEFESRPALPLEWRNNLWVVSGYRRRTVSPLRRIPAEPSRVPVLPVRRAGVMSAVGTIFVRLLSLVPFPAGRGGAETRMGELWTLGVAAFIPLTRWPALARSVFSLHNESLNIHTHFVPMVLWGAAFWGVGFQGEFYFVSLLSLSLPFLKPLAPWLEVPDAWARKWLHLPVPLLPLFRGSDANPIAPFQSPTPEAAESLFTLFALVCLACSALWHTMAGCAHRGAIEACAKVDYVGIGWLIATCIATVVHHGYACAEQAVDAMPLRHSILHPSTLLNSGAGAHAVEVLQERAADAVQALMHPSTLLHGAEKVVESGKWVDGVESGSVLADTLAGLASFTAPLRPLLGSLSSVTAPLRPLVTPVLAFAASLFAPVLDFASALNASVAPMVSATSNAMSATSNATSSLAAYHERGR
ncbi:hypothetical protein B0H13DRAFT_2320101 [Mycena leptocephala]|nr:hypothetical protein B0H13DRAFT_2320101 [Mycena leptocephala]